MGRRRWPVGLAWALAGLTVLGEAASVRLDRLLRQAGRSELTAVPPAGVPLVVAAVSAATVGAVLAGRRPRHPVGWLLLGLGLVASLSNFTYSYTRYGLVAGRARRPGPPTWPGSTTGSPSTGSPAPASSCC